MVEIGQKVCISKVRSVVGMGVCGGGGAPRSQLDFSSPAGPEWRNN